MSRTHFAYILGTIGFALILTAFPFFQNEDAPTTTKTLVDVASPEKSEKEPKVETEPAPLITETLPVFSKASLSVYNGKDPSLPIYIAFEGTVYDVTEGKRFYEPGGAYDFLSGTDGTELLKVVGGNTIKKKYPVVGTYTE